MWFLLFVVVASAVGIAIVLLRNRRPTSMDASIQDFERSLRALAPEPRSGFGTPGRRPAPPGDDEGAEHAG